MKIKGKSINNISGTLFFSILFSMFFLISTSYAQEAYITTDRDSYKDGDKIIISGNVGTLSESLPNTPVTIIIIGPTSNIAAFAQVTPDPSGQFSHSIRAGAPFQESGIYEVTSQYGTQKTFTTFSFTASVYNPPPPEPTPEPTLEPESIPEPEPVLSESVVFKNPRILDSFGNLITTASVGQFVTFTALVENQQSTKIPFAFATIVKNTQGIVQTEVWITGSLSPGQSFEPILTWETVAPVNYVFSFELWNNAKDRDLLAEPHTLQIAVEGDPEPEPTLQPTPEHEPVPEQEHEPVPEPTTPVMPSYGDVILSEGSGVPGCEETGECFIPLSIRVDTGDTVTWFNADTAAHTVTSGTPAGGPNGIFDSSLFGAGSTFKVRFDTTGEYPYFCMVHPWMVGKVAVKGTTVTSILTPPPVLEPEPTGFVGITVDSSVPGQTGQNTFEDTLDNAQEQIDNDISNPSSQDDDLSELIDENRKLREELERQGEQIDELSQEVDLLKQIIQSIQGFFTRIFG